MQNTDGKHLWTRLPGRFRRGLIVACATLFIGWTAAWSQTPPPARLPVSPEDAPPPVVAKQTGKERLREGTDVDNARGYFRFVNDRVVFMRSNDDARYTALENLNLERIVTEITNNPTQLEWTVFGTITEYHGANYLLIQRAVLARSTSDYGNSMVSTPSE